MKRKLYYKSNFSKLFLLSNQPILVSFETFDTKVIIPSINKILSYDKYTTFLSIFSTKENWTNNNLFIANNYYELILGLYNFSDISFFKELLNEFFPDLVVDAKSIKCGEIMVTPEQVDILIDMLLVGCNFMEFDAFNEKYNEEKEEDNGLEEWNRLLKEREEKIKRIKEKSSTTNKLKMEEIFIFIIHEFSQYTIKDLFEMNYFSIMFLFAWAQKISVQRVNEIAAGNGLLKEFKPLIN